MVWRKSLSTKLQTLNLLQMLTLNLPISLDLLTKSYGKTRHIFGKWIYSPIIRYVIYQKSVLPVNIRVKCLFALNLKVKSGRYSVKSLINLLLKKCCSIELMNTYKKLVSWYHPRKIGIIQRTNLNLETNTTYRLLFCCWLFCTIVWEKKRKLTENASIHKN